MRITLLAFVLAAAALVSTPSFADDDYPQQQPAEPQQQQQRYEEPRPIAGWFQGRAAKPINPRRTYAYRYYQGNSMYPKYNFGLHNRHLENIGVPSGDIGLRGNGYMMNPW